MLTPNNNIIIIDNEPDQLIELGKVFLENGLPCRTFEYDEFFKEPLSGVRIAFFDIKLAPSGGGSAEQTFSILAQALKLYISLENKPYILVFWTEHKDLANQFIEYIKGRKDNEIPIPYKIDCLDKLEVKDDSPKLKKKLEEILNDPILNVLFDFELNVFNAASKTLNSIFDIIPSTSNWVDNVPFRKNFEQILSKIASASIGFEQAKENPDKAIYEAFAPVITFHLLNSEIKNTWKDHLISLNDARKPDDLKYPQEFKQGKLNSIFHIDEKCYDKSTRGCLISCSDTILKGFNVEKENWIKTFVPLKSDFKAIVKEENTKKINELIKKSTIIAIEVSAACDYSNNNTRIHKYLLGIKIDKIDDGLKKSEKAACALPLGLFNLKNNEFEIWINLNFLIGTFPSDKRLKKAYCLLKKEMVDMIGNRYANHVSRIGITSF